MTSTFESILNTLTSYITEVSTLVGSFAYMILSAVTYKLLDLEGKIYAVKLDMDSDTADSDGLDVLAKNKGITRNPATVGIAKGKFDVEIPSGSRFQIGEIVWDSGDLIESSDYYYYKMTSEQTGTQVNSAIGTLTPITYISGLTVAEIVEMITLAEDEETDDELRERLNSKSSIEGFAGNKTAWKEFINALDGVGGCKLYPLKDGNGTATITFINSDFTPPSSTKIAEVQELVDPSKTGTGDGYAPIGAIITIAGVTYTDITVGVKCTFTTGTFEDWKTEIANLITSYFETLNKTWADSTSMVVRQAEIIAKLITSEHITDVTEVTINGASSNLILDDDKIANLSDVTEIS